MNIPAPMTDAELDAIEQYTKAATEWPWFSNVVISPPECAGQHERIASVDGNVSVNRQKANAEFIAHSRADITRLLSEVRRLREENVRYIAERDDLRRSVNQLAHELMAVREANRWMLDALKFIADRQNLMFAECTDAEEIIAKARNAIAVAEGSTK